MFFFATLGIIGCCHSGCYFCNSSHSGDKINTLVIIAGMTGLAVGCAIVILDVAVIFVIIIIVLSLGIWCTTCTLYLLPHTKQHKRLYMY